MCKTIKFIFVGENYWKAIKVLITKNASAMAYWW